MKILIDAFGGDNSPLEVIKGATEYVSEGGEAEICLVGKEEVIEKIFAVNGAIFTNHSSANFTAVQFIHFLDICSLKSSVVVCRINYISGFFHIAVQKSFSFKHRNKFNHGSSDNGSATITVEFKFKLFQS